jgi:hypothetical protein
MSLAGFKVGKAFRPIVLITGPKPFEAPTTRQNGFASWAGE